MLYPYDLLGEEERSEVYKKGLARCALSPLCGSSKSGCTAVGINNAEGCCVSDRVGTEHEKGGV